MKYYRKYLAKRVVVIDNLKKKTIKKIKTFMRNTGWVPRATNYLRKHHGSQILQKISIWQLPCLKLISSRHAKIIFPCTNIVQRETQMSNSGERKVAHIFK